MHFLLCSTCLVNLNICQAFTIVVKYSGHRSACCTSNLITHVARPSPLYISGLCNLFLRLLSPFHAHVLFNQDYLATYSLLSGIS